MEQEYGRPLNESARWVIRLQSQNRDIDTQHEELEVRRKQNLELLGELEKIAEFEAITDTDDVSEEGS